MDTQRILSRIAYVQAELDALAALVELEHQEQPAGEVSPPEPARKKAAPVTTARAREPVPAEPTGEPIGPAEVAQLVGVARQTIDRRLKDGASTGPLAPKNVSKGSARARWRWDSAQHARNWWAAVA